MKYTITSASFILTLFSVLSCSTALKGPSRLVGQVLSRFNRGGGTTRIIAKNEEETNLEIAPPLTQSAAIDIEREAPLMNDLNLLSDILSDLVNAEDPKVHDLYEEFRKLGIDRANDPNNVAALNKMTKRASQLSSQEAIGVIRTFSIMLNLVNSAEVQHRTRVTKEYHRTKTETEIGPLPLLEDSMRGTLDTLIKAGKKSKDEIYNQLLKQKVEIVLTAHPTQVQRKSLLRKYRKVSDTLAQMDRTDLNSFEQFSLSNELRRLISSIWGSDEIRRSKPTPQQEAAGGNAIIENVLWDAVPAYLRKLDIQCQISLGKRLPIEFVPIKFASWIGGDRDGKP
jgi:phosphoenolpyruvate carboxylase